MNCTEAEALLPDLLASSINLHERASLLQHMDACQYCREMVASMVEFSTRLDQLPVEVPSPALRAGFYQMLATAKAESDSRSRWRRSLFAQAAAILILVGAGFLSGYLIWGRKSDSMIGRNFALLHEHREDLRMAGVMLVSQEGAADPASAKVLLELLDHDPSDSVRISAVDALYLFGGQPQVREGLIASLPRQTSPRVQLALVDLLAGLRERRALEALSTLAQGPNTSPEVALRARAQLTGGSL